MALKKWQREYRDYFTALNNEDLFDEMLDAQMPDDWDGCFTDQGRWRADESTRQVCDRYARNTKLAALVTPELAALLGRLGDFAIYSRKGEKYDYQHWFDRPCSDDPFQALALAAKIKEALDEH